MARAALAQAVARAAAALAVAAAIPSGCGLGDSTQVECRCTAETDLDAFPQCRGAELSEGREGATDPLSTRIPDCPSGAPLFLREPKNPEAVLLNIRDTYEGFSPSQYMDQLTDDYLFVPDVGGAGLYLEVFRPPPGYNPDLPDVDTLWTREDERRFVNALLDRHRFQRLQFTRWYDASRDQSELYPDDSRRETFFFPYQIALTGQPDDEGTALITEVRGRAEVTMVTPSEENPVWSVRRWQDFRDEASAKPTLTELRGEYSQ